VMSTIIPASHRCDIRLTHVRPGSALCDRPETEMQVDGPT
jgi:hypothetical protein